MPEMSQAEAEAKLRADGRFDWLLRGQQAFSVTEVASAFAEHVGVPVSPDTVTRWMKDMGEGAEFYPGRIGYRARRDALIRFIAEGRHLRQSAAQ